MTNNEPLTDEQVIMLANDAMFDVMLQGEVSGYVSLQDIHLAIGRAIEQAHGIGMKNWNVLTFVNASSATTLPACLVRWVRGAPWSLR